MDTDEEYLDDLLEKMTNNDQQNRTMKDAMRDVKKISDEVKEMARASDIPETKSDTVSNDSDDWKASLDDILAQVDVDLQDDVPKTADSMQADMQSAGEQELDESFSDLFDADFDTINLEPIDTIDIDFMDTNTMERNPMDNSMDGNLMDGNPMDGDPMDAETVNTLNMEKMDVTDLLDTMDSADADLAEINGMLTKADKNEDVNDDILELLESVKADDGDEGDDSAFDIFDEHELKEVLRDGNNYVSSDEQPESMPEKKSKKKKRPKKEKVKKEKAQKEGGKKKKLFGKKAKEEDSEKDEQLTPDAEVEEQVNTDSADSEEFEFSFEKEPVEKKPGFFAKLKEMLTEADEGFEETQDGTDSVKEINESEREEIKKEAQKKKEKKEKNSKKEKGDPKKADKKKAEKKKKAKKEKQPKNEVHERPILSRKVLMLLVALCATLLASIFILSNLLPEYEQRLSVRTAYREKDYETVYKYLYNKKRNSDESVMYDRADLVLKLGRKWESYQNNMLLNRELDALNALMEGVNYYHSLAGTQEYETQAELDALYQQICAALGNYGITPEDAVEINAYDEVTYTKKLTAVVSGTDFDAPDEEKAPEEPAAPQDVLPEEEEIIGFDSDN